LNKTVPLSFILPWLPWLVDMATEKKKKKKKRGFMYFVDVFDWQSPVLLQ
jgi:hypothetical protein